MSCRTRPARARKLVALGFSLVLPVGAACWGARPEVGVVPGLRVSLPPFAGADTVVYQRTITRGGRDSASGTRTVVRSVVGALDGPPLLQVEQRFPGGGGQIVDTAVADFRTLRAVAHRSHQPKRTMRFDFVGDSAEGTVSANGSTADTARGTKDVRQALGGPLFDSNLLDLVVAALPLAPRFTAELPFFIYERGGRVPMPVTVRERARTAFPVLGNREVWVVSVGVPGAPATVWVDAASKSVLRVRYDIASAAMSVTDDRVTPIR